MLERLLSLRNEAEFYHRQLSEEARQYLRYRGLTDVLINVHCLGWNGSAITVPLESRDREVVSLLLMPIVGEKAPAEITDAQELYGWDTLAREPSRLVLTDIPLNRLILEAHGFPAVALPRHLESVKNEWIEVFSRIEKVYVTSEYLSKLLPAFHSVTLPEAASDIEGFFVRLGKNRRDFERLLRAADRRVAQRTDWTWTPKPSRATHRVARLLAEVPITEVIGQYTNLAPVNGSASAPCPLHEDNLRSLYVDPKGNSFRCFSCGAEGDAIDFLMAADKLTFWRAVDVLEGIRYADDADHAIT